jgi:hypothetical protein
MASNSTPPPAATLPRVPARHDPSAAIGMCNEADAGAYYTLVFDNDLIRHVKKHAHADVAIIANLQVGEISACILIAVGVVNTDKALEVDAITDSRAMAREQYRHQWLRAAREFRGHMAYSENVVKGRHFQKVRLHVKPKSYFAY